MKCPTCGNEVSSEEAFCGQCGTPNRPAARPTERASTPAPRNAPLGSYNTNNVSSNVYNQQRSPFPTSQPGFSASAPGQQNGFYQDATEAMSSLPNSPAVYPPSYSQSGVSNPSQAGQYGVQRQALPTNNYGSSSYQPPLITGQQYDYGNRGKLKPPQKRSNSAAVILISLCVVIVLIAAIGLGTLWYLKYQANTSASNSAVSTAATPTLAPTSVATVAPTPTVDMTTPTPTAIVTPTPSPDPNFLWCDATCTSNGFLVEYPESWQISPTTNVPGALFTNPAQPDVYAAFKAPGPTDATSASTLVANDLQTNYGMKDGYTVVPPPTPTTTIDGETWAVAVATYQLNGQKERVTAYGIVHQGKAYIIELEATDSQFDSLNMQFFNTMLGKFQFQ
jgi:hypothetical protein